MGSGSKPKNSTATSETPYEELSFGEKCARTRAKNKALQDAEEKKVASKPKKAHAAQTEAKEKRVWIESDRGKRKRQNSDAQKHLEPEQPPKSKKKRGRSASVRADEKDIVVLTDTKKDKGKSKAEAMVPAARLYPAPNFDQSSDDGDERTGRTASGSRRKQLNHDEQDDSSSGDLSVGSIRKDSEPEESEGEDGLKGDSQSIQETLALEAPRWATPAPVRAGSNAPRKLERKAAHSRSASASSCSLMFTFEPRYSPSGMQSPIAVDSDSSHRSFRFSSEENFGLRRESKAQPSSAAYRSLNRGHHYRSAREHASHPAKRTPSKRQIKQELEVQWTRVILLAD
ncbi:hypothetical protein FIBSPDRAFT_950033 [Athelia psychrophila]|uniref:Uncharacterized protein n=1 Tax=Athelia psychrophila TaxID=1759441 RepID=A0A166P218_9AGAM|nr:hypothetical protein FIBSPDRAFT_950033 [Fibularhizoctonia sp. CBS 109695]